MPPVEGSCEFTFNPESDARTADHGSDDPTPVIDGTELEIPERAHLDEEFLDSDGRWQCPHDVEPGADYCLFHQPPAEKDDEAVVRRLLDTLEHALGHDDDTATAHLYQFVGARFGDVDLTLLGHIGIPGPPLVLSHATFTGPFEIRFSEFKGGLQLNGARFEGPVKWVGLTVGGDFECREAVFADEVRCDITVDGKTTLSASRFHEDALFSDSRFHDKLRINETIFEGEFHLGNSQSDGDVRLGRSQFHQDAIFYHSEWGSGVTLFDCEFDESAYFDRSSFEQAAEIEHCDFHKTTIFTETVFSGETSFLETTFSGSAGFSGSVFRDDANFRKCTFEDDIDFGWSEFHQGAGFVGVDLSGAFFTRADLTDVTFTSADLRTAEFEGALLSRAMLFGADLRGAKLEGAVIGDIRIDEETRLLGHHAKSAPDSPHTIAAIRSRPCCAYDPAYGPHPDEEITNTDAAKSVYQMLEELGRRAARPRLQSRSFVRRQDLQRTEYWRDAFTESQIENRVIAGLRWARAKTARMTLLYGESPWRVIGGSLAAVAVFALLYPLVGGLVTSGGETLTYEYLLQYPGQFGQVLYYSASTLTPPILSDLQPVGVGRVLTTIQTGFGAVLVALLVFVLGRRAAR